MQDFKNLYAVSKTLCFELKPVGKTLNFIQEKKLIDKDEQRAKDYPIAKKIIDRYHQQFIEKALQSVPLNVEDF